MAARMILARWNDPQQSMPAQWVFWGASFFIMLVTISAGELVDQDGTTWSDRGPMERRPSRLKLPARSSFPNLTGRPGVCGIVIPTDILPKVKQRQACFAIQESGFLTRYRDVQKLHPSPWKSGVCLLLAFCGEKCRLIFQTPHVEQLNIKTSRNTSLQTDKTREEHDSSFSISANLPLPPSAPPLRSPVDFNKTAKPLPNSGLSPRQPYEIEKRFEVPRSSHKFYSSYKDCSHYAKENNKRTTCERMYSINFEAHNSGFSRMWGRLALLLGMAEIKDVYYIETIVQEYKLQQERAYKKFLETTSSAYIPLSEETQGNIAISPSQNINESPSLDAKKPLVRIYVGGSSPISDEPGSDTYTLNIEQRMHSQTSSPSYINILLDGEARGVQIIHASDEKLKEQKRQENVNEISHPVQSSESLRKRRLFQSVETKEAVVKLTSSYECLNAVHFLEMQEDHRWLAEYVTFLPNP